MQVSRVENLTFDKIQRVLSANHITADQKEQFLIANSVQIHQLMASKVNAPAFKVIMKNRPLKILRPLKNSVTKAGDKKILAEVLEIEPCDIDDYITEVGESIAANDLKNISKDNIETLKTYVYRHGKKEDVLNFLNFELNSAADTLHALYQTLSYETGGVADYFSRPIHRLDNKTMIDLYDVIDKNLSKAKEMGNLTEQDRESAAQWALVKIYEIQNNQHLKKALELKHRLESS